MTTYANLGSISHATLRSEDLLEAFTDCLLELSSNEKDSPCDHETRQAHIKLCAECCLLLDKNPDNWTEKDEEEASCIINESLFDALNEYAAPYCHFSSHEGDGTDFGFWPSIESLEEDARYDDEAVMKVNDLSEVSPESEFVMLVNDHGNVTLYRAKIELEEVWSVV